MRSLEKTGGSYIILQSAVAVSMPILILIPMLDLSSKIPSIGSMLYRVMVLEESAGPQ